LIPSKTDRILRQLKAPVSKIQRQTPIADSYFIPNHSGDHAAGRIQNRRLDTTTDVVTSTIEVVNTAKDNTLCLFQAYMEWKN